MSKSLILWAILSISLNIVGALPTNVDESESLATRFRTTTESDSNSTPVATFEDPDEEDTDSNRSPSSNNYAAQFRRDYAVSEIEYQHILDELRRQAEESAALLINDRANYIQNDQELAEFIRSTGSEDESGVVDKNDDLSSPTTRPSESSSNQLNREGITQTVEEGPDCSICMEPIDLSSGARESIELHCGHKFHFKCLKSWFASIRGVSIESFILLMSCDDVCRSQIHDC